MERNTALRVVEKIISHFRIPFSGNIWLRLGQTVESNDAGAIAEIYNDNIENTVITFEEEFVDSAWAGNRFRN